MSRQKEQQLGYEWKQASNDEFPEDAVRAGWDELDTLYIGRAHHEGETIPGKIVPSHGVCYVPYAGEEHKKSHYEVLCCQNSCPLKWIKTSNGEIPENAVEGGKTEYNESLYIGRASHEGTMTIGKIHPSHKCLYIPFAGGEHPYLEYEVLVCKSNCANK